ncbi:hypothetical protein LJC27_00045 [Christensenellaceae bacterium OttesenSCG-928-M15]|nr:hypothetical protein [Christensenellaceae bacterium OttesenSCG-928-M15]
MKVSRLLFRREKNGPVSAQAFLRLKADWGIFEDTCGGGDYQLSLITQSALHGVDLLNKRGLCMKKYFANIVLDGKDEGFLAGERYLLGSAQIEITRAGKKCFEECCLHKEGKSGDCPLQRSAFAKVRKDGLVGVGDLLEKTDLKEA